MSEEPKNIIGFTGTRRGLTPAQLDTFHQLVGEIQPREFHHGSCLGADEDAALSVSFRSDIRTDIMAWPGKPASGGANEFLSQRAIEASNYVMREMTHFARNREIVKAATHVIGCPWQASRPPKGTGGGTWYTLEQGEKAGKVVIVIWPDGTTLTLGPALPRRVVVDRDAGTVTDTRVVSQSATGEMTIGGTTYPAANIELSEVRTRKLPKAEG